MRVLAVLLALLLLLVGAAYVASPLYAYFELKSAAQSGNPAQMAAAVDFPSVRANLKTDLGARLAAAVNRNPGASGLGGQVALIGQLVMDRVIDATVTPEGMGDVIRAAKAPGLDGGGGPQAADSGAKVRTSLGFVDLTHFRVTFARGDKPDDRVGLILEQKAPFVWKVTRIELPPEAPQSAAALPSQPATEATPIGEGAPTAVDSTQVAAQPVAAQMAQPATGQTFGPTLAGAAPQPPQPAPPQMMAPPAPAPVPPRPRRVGPPPGSDAYICAHGDPNSDFTIQACDRRTLGR